MNLYYLIGNTADINESVLLSSLPDARRRTTERRPRTDRIVSAAAAQLLRYALHDAGMGAFCDAPMVWEGKPHFADPTIPLYFNFSHTAEKTGGAFAAAVLLSCGGEVGVDCEIPRPLHNREAMVQRIFTEAERTYLQTHGPHAFFDLWCAKEAYMKWTGEGFSRPMSRISVDLEQGFAESDGRRCAMYTGVFGGCVLACAAERIVDITETAVSPLQLQRFCKGEEQ